MVKKKIEWWMLVIALAVAFLLAKNTTYLGAVVRFPVCNIALTNTEPATVLQYHNELIKWPSPFKTYLLSNGVTISYLNTGGQNLILDMSDKTTFTSFADNSCLNSTYFSCKPMLTDALKCNEGYKVPLTIVANFSYYYFYNSNQYVHFCSADDKFYIVMQDQEVIDNYFRTFYGCEPPFNLFGKQNIMVMVAIGLTVMAGLGYYLHKRGVF